MQPRPIPIRSATVNGDRATLTLAEGLSPHDAGARLYVDDANGPQLFTARVGRLIEVRGRTATITLIPGREAAEMLRHVLADAPGELALLPGRGADGSTTLAVVLNDRAPDAAMNPADLNWHDAAPQPTEARRLAAKLFDGRD